MRQDNDLVVCQGLTKRFGRQTALDRLDLNLPRGKFIGLLGPNGSGKTTMIKLINGLLTPTEGTVLVDGQAPGPYTHSIISYLPDRPYLSDWMRVSDLLAFFSDFYKDFDQVKADEMLKDLKIGPGQRLKVLSKGTKEKVQLIGKPSSMCWMSPSPGWTRRLGTTSWALYCPITARRPVSCSPPT